MIIAKQIVAVLDANVLYPAPVRDMLLRLAETRLFLPRWSDQIHEEWIRNLLLKRTDLKLSLLEKTRQAMDSAFPEAKVAGFKSLIPGLRLPDKDDRHVLAAAIRCSANMIITFNKKDFPAGSVNSYRIEAIDPDEFICRLFATNRLKVLRAFYNQVTALKAPPQSNEQVLATLANCGLIQTATIIKEALGLNAG